MNKILLSIAALAVMAAPAMASAEQCRSQATGKFAKCGTPGAVPASKYVKKDGAAGKAMPSPFPREKQGWSGPLLMRWPRPCRWRRDWWW